MSKELNFLELANLQPRQLDFLHTILQKKYTVYGGAAGGGKSYSLRWICIYLLMYYSAKYNAQGVRAGLFSKDYPSLEDRHLSKVPFEFPEWLGTLNNQRHEFRLDPKWGGGVLAFRNLDNPSKYLSSEFAVIAVDELTENLKEVFDFIVMRLRWVNVPDTRFIAATNPGQSGHCVPFGDVLTRDGWKRIQDVTIGEEVLTLNENNEVIYEKVTQVHKNHYEGELLHYKDQYNEFICTPNHQYPIVTETKNNTGRTYHAPKNRKVSEFSQVTRFPTIGEWKGKYIEYFSLQQATHLRKRKQVQPLRLSGNDFCTLMGWFLSEGHVVERDYLFSISQKKLRNVDIIENLLKNCGFIYSYVGVSFNIYGFEWWDYMKQFGKCREKYVPDVIKHSSKEQLRIFFDAMMAGDGCNNIYYTTSEQLANDMQEIGHKLGYRTDIYSRRRKNRKGPSYEVRFKENKMPYIEKRNIKSETYKGDVYCLGIPNIHRFYLRQYNKILLSGNSWVKKLWVDRDFTDENYDPNDFAYVHATYSDNQYLDESYVKTLQSLPNELRRAYMEGDWDIFKGQFFPEFRREKHTQAPFTDPDTIEYFESLPTYCGLDYGYSAPSAVIWAKYYDEQWYVYRELYQTGLTYEQLAEKICTIEVPEVIYCDPAIWAKKDSPTSGADKMKQRARELGHQLNLKKAMNERVIGWNVLREFLHTETIHIYNTCKNIIKELPALVYATQKARVEDCDTDGLDHASDALRYLVATHKQIIAQKQKITYAKTKGYTPIGSQKVGEPSSDIESLFGTTTNNYSVNVLQRTNRRL